MVYLCLLNNVLQKTCLCSVCRKSIERKPPQEKREKEREHADDAKKKEKEKTVKEEPTKRPEKEIKKIELVAVKKPEPSVSPKKIQVTSLPVTRHRVSLINPLIIYLSHRLIKTFNICIDNIY